MDQRDDAWGLGILSQLDGCTGVSHTQIVSKANKQWYVLCNCITRCDSRLHIILPARFYLVFYLSYERRLYSSDPGEYDSYHYLILNVNPILRDMRYFFARVGRAAGAGGGQLLPTRYRFLPLH